MSTTHGETEWSNEGGSNNGGSTAGKVEWLHLSQGKHKVRLLSKPHKYPTHKGIKAEGEKGFGRKIPCSAQYTGTGKDTAYVEGTCPLCDTSHALDNKKLKPSTMYLFWVLDRATGTAKAIDVSYQIFSQIKQLSQDPDWGNPENYDLSIGKNPSSRGPSDYYTVLPVPNTTLSVADQQVRDTVDLDYLRKRTEPWTLESVQKLLDKVLKGAEMHFPPVEEKEEKTVDAKVETKAQVKPATNGKKAATVPAEVIESGDDDLETAFPSYDATN